MIKSPNKILKLLVVTGILFFIAQPYVGAAYAADDPVSAPAKEWADKAYKADAAGKYDEAIEYADKAIQINPDYAGAYNARGYARYQKKLFKEAIEDFGMTIKLKPDFPTAYVNRGSAKFFLGLFDSCIEDQDMAIKLSPDNGNAYFFRARAYHGKKLYDQAIADYSRALEIEPTASRFNRRADAYLGKGEHDLAVKDMKEAIRLAPENYELKAKLAKLEAKTGAEAPPDAASEDSLSYAVAPQQPGTEPTADGNAAASKPRTQVEALMPPIGPDEISVVLMGPAMDEQEKMMRDYFSSPMYDYFLQANNVFDVIPKLSGITRTTGKKIKYLILAGHGDPGAGMPGFGISIPRASGMSRRPVISSEAFGPDQIDRGQWEIDYKRLSDARTAILKSWAEGYSRNNAPEGKQKFEAAEKKMAETFQRLSAVNDITGIMAQDGVIIMFNCFSGIEGHREFARNLGRILFGTNGGKMLVHNTMIRVGRVPTRSEDDTAANMAFQTFAKFLSRVEEGYWRRGGEVFAWASFSEIPIEPVDYEPTPSVLYVSFKDPILIVNEGASVEIEPTVKGVSDRGAFNYNWYGECVGKIGPKCKLDIYDTAGKLLEGKVIVTDEKGRKGEATFYIYIQKILADIKLSEKAPAAGSIIDASAFVTQGKRHADTYWEWQAEGGLAPQQKYGDNIKVKVQGEGELKARLISDNALIGKGRVLAEASVAIKPKGQTKPPPGTDGSKQEKPEKPAGEGAPPTETAPPPAAPAGPSTGISAGAAIESSSGELEGEWKGSSYYGSGLRFSRNGTSYTGTFFDVTKIYFYGPTQVLRDGDVVFRLNRVSTHIYKGEERSINYDGTTEWRSVCLAVIGNELFYGGDYGEGELDGALSGIARRAESKTPRVVLTPSAIAPMRLGEKVSIKAFVTDAYTDDNPVRYTWSGDGEASNDTVTIVAKRPGNFKVSVSASGQTRNLGSASLEYVVGTIAVHVEKISPAADTIAVGEKAQFKAIAMSATGEAIQGLNFRWQPHPEVEFEPFEKSSTTTATFRRPGAYRIYAQALIKDGDSYVTAGESEEVAITVANPAWKLVFDPQEPLVGQEVKAKISPDSGQGAPAIDTKETNFRWQLSANARQTGTSKDDSQITFYLTDNKSAKISCIASTKYENENLGGAGRTIMAKAYSVTIIGPRPRQKLQKWKSNTELGGASSTGMRDAESPYVVGQEILFSSKIEPMPEKPVSYDWSVSPEDCTLNSNGGSDTSMTCRSAASYKVKVTARMDGMEIGSATAGVSVSAEPAAGQPGSPGKPIWKLVWGSLPSGWIVSNGALLNDRSNVIAGTGERNLVDNPGFSENVYFYFSAEPLPRYKIRAIVEVGPAREQDFSTPEKIAARFMDSKGRMTPGFQGTRECQFHGLRAIRYDVGSPKSTQKEWGYFIEVDPARKLWSAVMCHVEAVYSGPRDEGPSKEKQVSKRLELEQTVERLFEKQIRIKS